MAWNDWIGRRVKVVLNDGYTKYGLFVGADDRFIELEYESKGRERISIDSIAAMKDVVG